MKKLELNRMETLNGGKLTGPKVACYLIASVAGLANPFAGIGIGFSCLMMEPEFSANQ